ncbi:MAG: hypothetical protein GXX91_11740 [Verrucomicrobiaceae bacterium]|nr:hypothetical protein [Verrucomicrobiaceae bacterium]
MNQRKSPDQWCAILADYERSGLSQADFCRRHRLALSTFHYHRKRRRSSSAPAGRLIELRAAPPTVPAPAKAPTASAGAAGRASLRMDIPLCSSRTVTLHCPLERLSEVIAQLSRPTPLPER